MDSQFDEAIAKLNHLSFVRQRFLIRAELLPADLALVGLYNDLRDAAFLAVELCHLHAQSAAFPLARTVFEATEQIIVVATEDDYLSVGTRAWLYHLRKEKRIAHSARGTEAAQDWFQQAVCEIQRIWAEYNSNAEKTVRHKNAQLDAFRKDRGRADNFMGCITSSLTEASAGISTTFHFSNVPVQKVGILPNGTVSWSSEITLGEQEAYIATFDVPQLLVSELQRALEVESSALTPCSQVKRLRLMQPRTVPLECTLGEIQNLSGGSFVPLSVTKIVIQEIEPENRPN